MFSVPIVIAVLFLLCRGVSCVCMRLNSHVKDYAPGEVPVRNILQMWSLSSLLVSFGIVLFLHINYTLFFLIYHAQYQKRRQEREKERRRLHPLEEHLQQRLVGQDNAINVVSAGMECSFVKFCWICYWYVWCGTFRTC